MYLDINLNSFDIITKPQKALIKFIASSLLTYFCFIRVMRRGVQYGKSTSNNFYGTSCGINKLTLNLDGNCACHTGHTIVINDLFVLVDFELTLFNSNIR